jgi:branched-chain amino acid transport system ATP-binding protein
MLRLERVCAGYGDLQVLWDLSLEVRKGEIVALVGGNGAGKTTTLKVVTGLLRMKSGEVAYEGKSLVNLKPHEIVSLGISMVPEGRRLFGKMTVYDNLLVGSFQKRTKEERASRMDWVYGLFPILRQRRDQVAGSLSGGEQQMLAIGRALMADNPLLILDEMSLGLAPRIVNEIFEVMVRLNRSGMSILLVEQDVPDTLDIAHRGYVLENGRIVKEGPAADLANDPHVREAYLGLSA